MKGKKCYTAYLSKDLSDKIDDIISRENITESNIIELIIKRYFQNKCNYCIHEFIIVPDCSQTGVLNYEDCPAKSQCKKCGYEPKY